MRKTLLTTLLAGAMVLALQPFSGTGALAQEKKAPEKKEAPEPMKLKVGDMAPDFSVFAFDGQHLKKVSLSDYRGKKQVALAFYVFAFTGG
jgi:hypothetical protein